MTDQSLLTPCTDFGETRIFFDLDSPSLVIGEMPVERIHFVQREEVDELGSPLHVDAGYAQLPLEPGSGVSWNQEQISRCIT